MGLSAGAGAGRVDSLGNVSMLFRLLLDDVTGQMTYLIADAHDSRRIDGARGRDAVLVDPIGRDVPVLQALLQEHDLRLQWVLRTHHHDGEADAERRRLMALNAPIVQGEPADGTEQVDDGAELAFGGQHIRVMATPGHTPHCLSFIWRDRVYCGGALAALQCVRQPVPALPEVLWESVNRQLFTLPDETLLFSGHAEEGRSVATVQEVRRWHPLFACLSRDEYLGKVNDWRGEAEGRPTEFAHAS